MKRYMNFGVALRDIVRDFKESSTLIHTEKWQGVDISKKPDMATFEQRHVGFQVALPNEDLTHYQRQIAPNLPWADKHFEERVCGFPINPGVEWRNWPWGLNAQKFLNDEGKFNHNYMERYWPKHAGIPKATNTADEYDKLLTSSEFMGMTNFGIYHELGDLRDVINQLNREPHTRQAVLPIFFPEDTGGGDRVPCSMYYQFIMRNMEMDIVYPIRSCDIVRHFRDDIYMTVRLLLWVLEELRKLDGKWIEVKPGDFVMMITSLHCFINDKGKL